VQKSEGGEKGHKKGGKRRGSEICKDESKTCDLGSKAKKKARERSSVLID